MSIDKMTKQELVKEFSRTDGDTGSPEVQCALFTHHINNLTEHLKNNKKDYQTRRGLLVYVIKRKRLLKYLNRVDSSKWAELMKKLKIKKI